MQPFWLSTLTLKKCTLYVFSTFLPIVLAVTLSLTETKFFSSTNFLDIRFTLLSVSNRETILRPLIIALIFIERAIASFSLQGSESLLSLTRWKGTFCWNFWRLRSWRQQIICNAAIIGAKKILSVLESLKDVPKLEPLQSFSSVSLTWLEASKLRCFLTVNTLLTSVWCCYKWSIGLWTDIGHAYIWPNCFF